MAEFLARWQSEPLIKWSHLVVGGVLFGTALAALATPTHRVFIAAAWVRATAPGQPVAAAYMQLTSNEGGQLRDVSADAAAEVEVHDMRMDGEIMRMRQIHRLALPKAATVRLSPGGTHLMLLGLKRVLKPGEIVRFTLTVLDAQGHDQIVHVNAPVRLTALREIQ